MDSALDKVGLYDFFGVFISGMLAVGLGIILDIPLNIIIENTNNDIISIILFMLESYFLGLILQEIASFLDEKILKFRKKAMTNFLNENNKIITNKLELKDFKILASKILNMQETNCEYNEDQSRKVYHSCKTYLEIYEKDTKDKRINSLYAMSRSLMVLFFVYSIIYLLLHVPTFDCKDFMIIFSLVLLTYIFGRRAKRYSMYRVRDILRKYQMLTKYNQH